MPGTKYLEISCISISRNSHRPGYEIRRRLLWLCLRGEDIYHDDQDKNRATHGYLVVTWPLLSGSAFNGQPTSTNSQPTTLTRTLASNLYRPSRSFPSLFPSSLCSTQSFPHRLPSSILSNPTLLTHDEEHHCCTPRIECWKCYCAVLRPLR
jgi:hypothetical protein